MREDTGNFHYPLSADPQNAPDRRPILSQAEPLDGEEASFFGGAS